MNNIERMRADVNLDHKQRAKRVAQTPAEYADPFERHRRPVSKATRLGYAITALIVMGAIYLLGAR